MKPILILTFLLALFAAVCTGCLLIFGVFDAARAGSFLLRVVAAIALLGCSSALIAWIIRRPDFSDRQPSA
jgi:hypothetical protein